MGYGQAGPHLQGKVIVEQEALVALLLEELVIEDCDLQTEKRKSVKGAMSYGAGLTILA